MPWDALGCLKISPLPLLLTRKDLGSWEYFSCSFLLIYFPSCSGMLREILLGCFEILSACSVIFKRTLPRML